MKTYFFTFVLSMFFVVNIFAQDVLGQDTSGVLITDSTLDKIDPSAILQLSSTTKGFLVPKLSKKQREAIKNPAEALLVYQTDTLKGFYYVKDKKWLRLEDETTVWKKNGNDKVKATDFVGTKNNMPLNFGVNDTILMRLNSYSNLSFMTSNITISLQTADVRIKGADNIDIGAKNSKTILGNNNTNIGSQSGAAFTTGWDNTNIGFQAGHHNDSDNNTYIGSKAGQNNKGSSNVFLGYNAGANAKNASDSIIISNSPTKNLIEGNFAKSTLKIGGELGIEGNLSKINGVSYKFMTVQGTKNTFLRNDGKGNLTWADASQEGNYWGINGNFVSADAFIGTINNESLKFRVKNQERMRLYPDGRLSLGQNGNIVIGDSSAYQLDFNNEFVSLYPSIYFGKSAAKNTKIASDNIGIGYQALAANIEGGGNVILGNNAGQFNTASKGNVLIGNQTGMKNQGSNNVMIGNLAGSKEINLNNALIIANNADSELIHGNFADKFVSVNGVLVVGNSQIKQNGAIKYEKDAFWGHIKGVSRKFLLDDSTFVRRDGSLPLKGDWKVGESLLDVDSISAEDMHLNGFLTAQRGIQSNLFRLQNDTEVQFITPQISAFSQHNELPTSRAVADFVTSQILANNQVNNANIFASTAQDYLKKDGSTPLTKDWNVGNFNLNNIRNIQTATLQLNGRLATEISDIISKNSNSQELATTKGVYDFVNTQINTIPLTSAIMQNGNTFGTEVVIGANDNQNLIFKANNAEMTFMTNGALYRGLSTGGHIFIGEGAGSNMEFVDADVMLYPNTFIGYGAGSSNTSGYLNHFIGHTAGLYNRTGSNNYFSGHRAGSSNTTGSGNYFSGNFAGHSNTTGIQNYFSGNNAGAYNTTGSKNVIIGLSSGTNFQTISESVMIGTWSGGSGGYTTSVPTIGNVFIGFRAGENELGSNKLHIANNENESLIYGDFATAFISINGDLGIKNNLKFANGSHSVNMITAQISSSSTNSQLATTKGVFDFVSVNSVGNILQNGNTFGTAIVIGTNDNQNLIFKANNAKMLFTTTGALQMGNSGNIFIGEGAGLNTDLSLISVQMYSNIFVGKNSGKKNTQGIHNTFMGNLAGANNTTGSANTFIGATAGTSNITGFQNTFIGFAGGSNTSGYQNTIVGSFAGGQNTTGYYNTFIGNDAGAAHKSGYMNTFLGMGAGGGNITGYMNTFLGMGAGGGNITGHNNVFLGFGAGNADTGSDKLHIANNGYISLIEGSFVTANPFVSVNGSLAVRDNLKVGNLTTGFVSVTGGVLVDSDERYKTNIQALENPLEKILQIGGYSYDYKTAEFPNKNFPKTQQIGVIAQEVEAVFPELVATDANGYKSVDYAKLTPILLEALKAQQKQIDAQNKKLQDLEQKMDKVYEMLQK